MIDFGASAETYFKFRISIGFSVRPDVLLGLSSTERLPKANYSLAGTNHPHVILLKSCQSVPFGYQRPADGLNIQNVS